VVAGPALLLGTKDGVEAFALSTGKPVWSWKAKKADKGLCLGPSFGGQVLVLTGEAVLLNPFTGLVTRRFPRAVETEDQDTGDHPALVAVATSFAIFREGKGDMVGTDLRTGKRAFVREGLLQGAKKIIVKEGILVVLAEGGLLFGLSADGKRKLWETKLGGEYSFLSSAKGELACVGSKGGSLVCISSRTGLPLWKSSLEGELRGLYTEETTGDLIAAELLRENKRITGFLSTGNGRLEWELEASNAESVSVHALDRAVLVSSPSRGIVAFRKP